MFTRFQDTIFRFRTVPRWYWKVLQLWFESQKEFRISERATFVIPSQTPEPAKIPIHAENPIQDQKWYPVDTPTSSERSLRVLWLSQPTRETGRDEFWNCIFVIFDEIAVKMRLKQHKNAQTAQ